MRLRPHSAQQLHAQRGSAIILAMLVVALVAVMVTGVFWRQHVMVRTVENEQLTAQTRWLLYGAVDWARVILREDGRTTAVDHLGEAWAVALADTRVNEDDGRTPAYLSGQIVDEQSKFNLRNLVNQQGIVPKELEAFRRLLRNVDVPDRLAEAIALRVSESMAIQDSEQNMLSPTQFALRTVEDLQLIQLTRSGTSVASGVTSSEARSTVLTREQFERLSPFITVLPIPTPVNANTASAQVLSARIAGMTLADAQRLVSSRERSYLKDTADALNRLPGQRYSAGDDEIVAYTRFFTVNGRVTYGRALMRGQALVLRENTATRVLWQRELLD